MDAHIHLADPGYAGKIEQIIDDSTQHNVNHLLSNATDYQTSLDTVKLAKRFPNRVLAAVGVHPSTVLQSDPLFLDKFNELIDQSKESIYSIGEVGLDGKYTQDQQIKAKQAEVFRFFLSLAQDRHLPVTVHSRQAVPETLDTLQDFNLSGVLLHWYDGPTETLQTIKQRGYFLSFGPALLYSHRLVEIAHASDPDMILSETDGPVTFRRLFGNRMTQPSFVIEVVRKLADLKGMTLGDMQSTISANFHKLTEV